MRNNPYPVVDGDGHVMERNSELVKYLGGNYTLLEIDRSKDENERNLLGESYIRWFLDRENVKNGA